MDNGQTETPIINQLPLQDKESVRRQVETIIETENRSETEVVAELVENSLPDEDYVLEATREGDAAAAGGGIGASNGAALRYLANTG